MSELRDMDEFQEQTEGHAGRPQARSFAKRIAEAALVLELSGQSDGPAAIETAASEFARGRGVPGSTMKRCASEARALIDHARSSGAIDRIAARADGEEWRIDQEVAAWLDETSLPAVLKQRALRLNRSRGGRPSSKTRTLRAVEELLEFARAGRPGALDELRSIKALFESDAIPAPLNS
jgi:hypothetical protein